MMRKWIVVALIVIAILWWLLNTIGYSIALSDFANRPITALDREGERIPVQPSGRQPQPGEAKGLGGEGIYFGLTSVYQLPDGSIVTCRQRFRSLSCDGGWVPERAGQ
jgi:hypothetical protein